MDVKPTNIEKAIETALSNTGTEYVREHGIPKVATVDFFLPALNAIIFCDGDYWHSLPDKVKRDAKQTQQLMDMGFTVHRFLGSVILENPEACVQHVLSESPSRTSDKTQQPP